MPLIKGSNVPLMISATGAGVTGYRPVHLCCQNLDHSEVTGLASRKAVEGMLRN